AGEESLNVTSYGNCHEFGSESVLRLDPSSVDTTETEGSTSPSGENAIPPGLHFDLRIVTPVDSDISATGDPVEAVLRSPFRDKKGNVLAAVGTHLHGRLAFLEYESQLRSLFFFVLLESIDLNGTTTPISLILNPAATPTLGFATHSTVSGSLTVTS